MLIRTLQSEEMNELLALYTHLHRADDPRPEPSVVQAVWQELLANPRYQYFGGFLDGVLIASCALTLIPNLTRGCRPYGVIENVVTHTSHRNQGRGQAVLAHALSHAWAAGCYKVMLMTGRKDEATFRFYESQASTATANKPSSPSRRIDLHHAMPFVVTEACIRCKYTDCVNVCPMDCFVEGPNFLVIDPSECIDCSVCVPECPVGAIVNADEVAPDQALFVELNARLAKDPGWRPITEPKPPLSDHAVWAAVRDKREHLQLSW